MKLCERCGVHPVIDEKSLVIYSAICDACEVEMHDQNFLDSITRAATEYRRRDREIFHPITFVLPGWLYDMAEEVGFDMRHYTRMDPL